MSTSRPGRGWTIGKVAPRLVGVEDVAAAEEILKELRDEMLDEIGTIEREMGLVV